MKVTRANEYWGIPEETPQRVAAPLTPAQVRELTGGSRVHGGLLRWADADNPAAAEVEDPSSSGALPKVVPHLKRLERSLGNQGGASGNDGSPEHWPVTLPGDKLMNAAGGAADMGMDVMESKLPLPKKAARRFRRTAAAPDPYDLAPTNIHTDSTHGAEVHSNGQGQNWLVKHPSWDESWPAPLDVATAQLQQRSGLPTPEIHQVNMNGVPTAVHRMIPGAQKAFPNKGNISHENMSPEDIMTLQKHNVLDWLIANHDSHPGQFIRDGQGQLIGIDKGQAFKHMGVDQLDHNFHPNAAYGETEPIYNTMWRNFAQGRGHMNDPRTGELGQYIQNLQSMPDEELHGILRPYAEQAAMAGKLGTGGGGGLGKPIDMHPNDPDSFLSAVSRRRDNLMNDFGAYYDRMAGKQRQYVGRRQRVPAYL
jgi:hypothetical protein